MPDALERTLQPTRRTLGDVDLTQPLDPTSSLTDGLQGFWLPLPRTTGGSRLYDLSSHSNHGDLINIPTSRWGASEGFSLPALRVEQENQNNERVEVPSPNGLTGTNAFTIVSWARLDDFQDDRFLIGQRTGDNDPERQIYIWADKNGFNDGGIEVWSFGFRTTDGTWNQLEGTQDNVVDTGRFVLIAGRWQSGDIWDVSVNGSIVASTSPVTGTFENTNDSGYALYDRSNSENSSWYGPTSLLALYNRALSLKELQSMAQEARRGFPNVLRRSDVGLLGGGGGTIVTVSEAAALAAQANLQTTDTALSSESAALSATGTPTATDSATATEQAAIGSTATLNANETATITEALTLAATATWSVTEAVGSAVTEAATLAVTTSLSATDTATATESAQVSSQVSLAAQEAATASEALQLETEARLDAQESITVTEAAQIEVNAALDLIEEASAMEAAKIGVVAAWSVTETAGKLITGRISEVGRNTVELLSRPFNNAERKDG
jgi:hypothetical protein